MLFFEIDPKKKKTIILIKKYFIYVLKILVSWLDWITHASN